MSILKDKGIIKSEGVTSLLFDGFTPNGSFLDVKYSTPKEYIKYYWDKYQASLEKNNSIFLSYCYFQDGLTIHALSYYICYTLQTH